MIVPITKGAGGGQSSGAFANMPSETNLLLALGAMHKNGYFDQDSKLPKVKPILPGGEK